MLLVRTMRMAAESSRGRAKRPAEHGPAQQAMSDSLSAGVVFGVRCGVFPLQGVATRCCGLFGQPAFPLMASKFFLAIEVAAASVAAKLVCLGRGTIRIGSE